jgi:hypothetical protein
MLPILWFSPFELWTLPVDSKERRSTNQRERARARPRLPATRNCYTRRRKMCRPGDAAPLSRRPDRQGDDRSRLLRQGKQDREGAGVRMYPLVTDQLEPAHSACAHARACGRPRGRWRPAKSSHSRRRGESRGRGHW